jgi:serine/threonine-protein kinase HipA
MAVEGRNRHYALHDIHHGHWVAMAQSLGLVDGAEPLITELIEHTPAAFDAVAKRLPDDFPMALFDSVKAGTVAAIKRLGGEPSRRAGARGAG